MFSTSSQKKHWTFGSADELQTLRTTANNNYIARFRPVLESPEQEQQFLTPDEESLLCQIVTETGIRFGDDFKPSIWPSTRWIAFAYFKRFFLRQSTMEYYPKNVMMACYFLATKVDEFNVSIDDFVSNLRNGSRESNVETITTLEPELIAKLNYHLTVHCPYRPLEGHFIGLRTMCSLGFDLELARPHCFAFLRKSLMSDVMLLHAPSHIALAALQYGLKSIGVMDEVLREYLVKIVDSDASSVDAAGRMLVVERMLLQMERIADAVNVDRPAVSAAVSSALQTKMHALAQLQSKFAKVLRTQDTTEPFDSDDDF